jgi:hypothetical protein
MNQRRRLAVLSEHMESRLVLSPVVMLPIHGGEPIAETPTDDSVASERPADRSEVASQTSQRISNVHNETAPQDSSDGGAGPRSKTAGDRTSLSPIVETRLNADTTGVTSGTSSTTTEIAIDVGSHQSTGGTTLTVADGGVRSPAASAPTAESTLIDSSPVSADVVVKQEQRSAGDVDAKEQSSAENEVSAAPMASSDTVTVPVTDTLSRVNGDSASATDTSTSKVTTVSSVVEASVVRLREDSGTELTSNENGDAYQTTEVRSVSPETKQDVVFGAVETEGRESADGVAVLEDTRRTASVSTDSKVDSEQRDVVTTTVAANFPTSSPDRQQRSDVRPAAVTDADSQARQSDVTIVASDRIRKTNADTDATAPSINEAVLPVEVAEGLDEPPTHVARVNDAVEGRVVPVVVSGPQQKDTSSGLNEDRQTVGSTTETDVDTQPVPAEMPLVAGGETSNIWSVSMEQTPDGRIEEAQKSVGWLSDIAHAPEAHPAAHLPAATTSDSSTSLQWLMMAEAPPVTDADHERSESTHTFFGDATRVGLMLAAVRHAGRRSGSVFSVVDSPEELRGEGAAYSKERRRRRAATARRMPTTFDRLRQAIHSLESVDEHNSLPNAVPSPDAVFADAASMSLLYQNNFGSSHSERSGFLWGSLLLGGGALAANRASRSRKSQPRRELIPPSAPRNGGETLRFAD